MKKKPIFTILITFIIIIIAYFAFWHILANKTKGKIEEEILESGIDFKDISISGFPFSKNIKISDLEFKNDVNNLTKDVLKIEKVTLSSFILGSSYSASLKDITYYDSSKKETDTIKFNSVPVIKVAFYKNGELKSFIYKDTGYKVLDATNKTLFSAGVSNVEVYSTLTKNTADYSIQANFSEIQDFNILANEITTESGETALIPNSYDFNVDVSSSIKTKNEQTIESSIKINNISLKNRVRDIQISINGEVENDEEDPMLSGKLKVKIENFDKLVAVLLNELKDMQKANPNKNPKNDALMLKTFSNNVQAVKSLADKNKETTKEDAVFLIERAKKENDYRINDKSLLTFMEEQNKKAQMQLERQQLKTQQMQLEKERLEKEKMQNENKGETKTDSEPKQEKKKK